MSAIFCWTINQSNCVNFYLIIITVYMILHDVQVNLYYVSTCYYQLILVDKTGVDYE